MPLLTLHLLNYLNDEGYRRRIQTQLNRGESRHSLARAVFHGRRDEVRERYRDGQEDVLGALGFIVNALSCGTPGTPQRFWSGWRASART